MLEILQLHADHAIEAEIPRAEITKGGAASAWHGAPRRRVINQLYGMSETTGGISMCTNNRFRLGSVGFINKYNRIKISSPDEKGIGEICISGENVFMGYMNSSNKTSEAFDDERYLRSGDLGRIDQDGFLFITGRIKELIVTAGGENVAPLPIEDAIKNELPEIVSNCMVIGDNKQFLTALVTLKVRLSNSLIKHNLNDSN
jgi:long-chain-fatty-acid--CoA ligase ACSBG